MTPLEDFMRLFRGRTDAYGTGRGEWVRQPLLASHYASHLAGEGPGLGVAPLLDDGTVWFAAIDLDEPDFEAARTMQELLPGTTFIERSRSGNAHVWAFFERPIQAWIPRGIMREATRAAGKEHVEVFPKQDRLLEGMLGNYINLPYHGDERPMLPEGQQVAYGYGGPGGGTLDLSTFLAAASVRRNDPEEWQIRAEWLQIVSPEERAERDGPGAEFGTQAELHICAQHMLAHRFDNPITEGGRNQVMFHFAKMVLNWREVDDEEAWELYEMMNETAQPPLGDYDLHRHFDNAKRGQFTSTGCDDPLMAPYVHPDCPIAHR